MTSYQRVMTALGGGKPDRVPVMVFNRDWTVNHLGFSAEDMLGNAERFVFAQYYCARSFGYDVVQDAPWRFTDDPDDPAIELLFPSDPAVRSGFRR